jgi:hypothetical protein
LTSDAGEVAAAVERCVFYGHELDTTNLVEELGDCLWYIAQACNALDVSLSSVMEGNIAKLQKRYPQKFDEAQAEEINRDRAAERAALEAFACPSCGTDERVACDMPSKSVKDACSGHLCPCCMNPISDEVVRRLYLHEQDVAGCPQCRLPFFFDNSTGKLCRAKS